MLNFDFECRTCGAMLGIETIHIPRFCPICGKNLIDDIVRCRSCISYKRGGEVSYCFLHRHKANDDDFCSWAESRF